MQIRTRLTLLYLAIAAVILALVLVAVWVVFKKDTEENFYKNLRSQAQLAANNPQFTAEKTAVLWSAPEGDTLPYLENVSVYNDAYERVFSLFPEAVPVSVKVLQDVQTKGEIRFRHYNLHALGLSFRDNKQRQFVVVAEGQCDDTALWNLSRILVMASGWHEFKEEFILVVNVDFHGVGYFVVDNMLFGLTACAL